MTAVLVHVSAIDVADTACPARALGAAGVDGMATVRAFEPGNWDRSRAMNAPGQSGSPESPHFSDLAKLWASGDDVTLVYSDAAVQANRESTLTLVPMKAAPAPGAR